MKGQRNFDGTTSTKCVLRSLVPQELGYRLNLQLRTSTQTITKEFDYDWFNNWGNRIPN